MGCTVKERSIRNNHRKFQPIPIKPDNANPSTPSTRSAPKSPNPLLELPNPNPNPNFDETSWGYCTEEQLEESLLRNLEFLYDEAISKIVSLGFDEDVALKSILRNGHCYGSMDVMTNILHNAMAYIHKIGDDEDVDDRGGSSEKPESGFVDLRQLVEYSLQGMVCLIQQVRPQFSRFDAMWCLLMNDLHVGRASTMEIPVSPSDNGINGGAVNANVPPGPWGCRGAELPAGGLGYDPAMVNLAPALPSNIEFPKRFNLSPSMKARLKRNVAIFTAGFQASAKAAMQLQAQSHVCSSSSSSNDLQLGVSAGSDCSMEKYTGGIHSHNSDIMTTVMGSLGNMTIDDKSDGNDDQRDKMILNLTHQIAELEVQLKERREWAQQKAMQAGRKLSNDLMELKMLRMEREETFRLKEGKHALEDTTMKRLSEMENALRKASGQVDRANAAVKRLETENAEIRAEIEASKLSASESVTSCLEVAKREKKCLKKLLAFEKQKDKLQMEIAEEKKKIAQLHQQLQLVKEAQKETEIKWRQELDAKELAIAQWEEQRRSKEAAEANVKRREEDLRRKIEIDFQCDKDDIQRLEQELSRLRASAESTQPNRPPNAFGKQELDTSKTARETCLRMLHDMNKLQEPSRKEVGHDRECIICTKDEVSVVFLPCAHQVLCVGCNEDHEKAVKTRCPCCSIQIEERIHVYGATS